MNIAQENHALAHNDLMHALKFTADDLEANRAGQLSPHQQSQYRINRFVSGFFLLFCGALFVIFGIGAVRSDGFALMLAFIFLIVNLNLGIYLKTALSINSEVLILRGIIQKKYVRKQRTYRGVIHLGPDEFNITPEGFNALIETHEYLLYVEPVTKHILTAEPAMSNSGQG